MAPLAVPSGVRSNNGTSSYSVTRGLRHEDARRNAIDINVWLFANESADAAQLVRRWWGQRITKVTNVALGKALRALLEAEFLKPICNLFHRGPQRDIPPDGLLANRS